MAQIADLIVEILEHTRPLPGKNGQLSKALCETEPTVLEKVKKEVKLLLNRFPLYPELPNFHNQEQIVKK